MQRLEIVLATEESCMDFTLDQQFLFIFWSMVNCYESLATWYSIELNSNRQRYLLGVDVYWVEICNFFLDWLDFCIVSWMVLLFWWDNCCCLFFVAILFVTYLVWAQTVVIPKATIGQVELKLWSAKKHSNKKP